MTGGEPLAPAAAPSRAAPPADARLVRAVTRLARVPGPLVLAVSGGADSMALLALVAAEPALAARATVATFDHGTGAWARRAAALVRREARRRGLPVVVGRSRRPGRTEAEWRRQRWAFLRRVAGRRGARVVTAHTRDDQLETVVLRLLRGSGARGLAGLLAPSPVLRPLLGVGRRRLRRFARAAGVPFREDPSNRAVRHARTRVRHDLLPALRRVRPELPRELLALARRAARWRRGLDARLLAEVRPTVERDGSLRIATSALEGYDAAALRVAWPALAGMVGAVLDRRGTCRLAAFSRKAANGSRIPLSGGWEAIRRRDAFLLRRAVRVPTGTVLVSAEGEAVLGRWRLRPASAAAVQAAGTWGAVLPASGPLLARAWRAGDRVRPVGRAQARRVKRYLSEVGVAGPEREGWPVVLHADEIVWIPGVCRSDAATVRPGRPGRPYLCERR